MVTMCRGNIRHTQAMHDMSLIYELSQVFHDTEHNLHQLGAEDGTPHTITHTHTHTHTRTHNHTKGIRITNDGRKWWWLTIMCSKVRNTQMELEPCHRGWWVVLLIYVPCRWRIALCHLCPAGAYRNSRHLSELFCHCLAGTRRGSQFHQKRCYTPENYTVHSFLRLLCQGIMRLSPVKNEFMRIMQDIFCYCNSII